ncbi:alpha-L-fucosidase [Cohnella thailandensis]|uniref:alpha-L-fucosidase n=1 Tax=Cohnella thailandensis TaxID=557557 RepID=A0A841SYY6_9BACL|nr:alpha-L-fucosidase [Cohnella thailandensis]MBB6637124.1 alpha-L-fucosidase [Cohnella thailandensis]MBP1977058.1 alpha-L-fucosidase [Cohnella thailandensis]
MGVTIGEAARVAPSDRQLAWQELEFYAFIHFTVNTFTDREWGTGEEKPEVFNPAELDASQWIEVCKSGGMKAVILTCKHHDGFCLWPSRQTPHTVRNSPWRDGQGDLVREVADACRAAGLKFGIYLSPWDRHEPSYGDSDRYNSFFVEQLKELLTGYGELFCVWFDGACGEGPNGKRQAYDWDAYYLVIRELQPNAVISVCGPDVRWCGNEAGHTRRNEWSVVPASMRDNEKIQSESQQEDDPEFARRAGSGDEDLGSRAVLDRTDEVIWYPAEVNTSIRPGWFYHASEDSRVKSTEELIDLYERTVGGNSTFLLNLPPDLRGLIHETDAERLKELGNRLRARYRYNLAAEAQVSADESLDADHSPDKLVDGRSDTYWSAPHGSEQAAIELDLGSEKLFDRIVLGEYIREGQRIERFRLEREAGGEWLPFYEGEVVGYKKICRFDPIRARRIRIRILESRWCPTLKEVGVFRTEVAYEETREQSG